MDEELNLILPDRNKIMCRNCKYGAHNFMSEYCAKYKIKPRPVYYENSVCEKFETLK